MPHQQNQQQGQQPQVQQNLREIEQHCNQLRQADDPQQAKRHIQEIRSCCDTIEQQLHS